MTIADKLMQQLDEIGVTFPLGQGRPFQCAVEAAIQEARNQALEEAAQHMETRANTISGADNVTAHAIARVYRDEAQAIRALKVGE